MRIVFDTNVLISALLIKTSVPAQALSLAEARGDIVYSQECLSEIADVLSRPKLQPYIEPEDVTGFLARIHRSWIEIPILQRITLCRDPRDDKFLELALNGDASFIVTGDEDLLTLHPFQDIPILKPADYLLKG